MQFRTKKTGKKISLTYLGEVDNPSPSIATTEKKAPEAGPSNEPVFSQAAATDAIAGSADSAHMEVDVEEPQETVPEPLPVASPVLWTFPNQKRIDALTSLTRPARKANISIQVKKSRDARVSSVSVANEFKEKGQSTVKGADGACVYWSSTLDSPVSCLQANV
ncbi:hypothetical protein AAVH_38853 [Aphelenchoides avenae]|nr:hypothetical protein AAVH_38853 [Aphelenchus avenae]